MLNEVPEGWAVEVFDKVARLQSGFAFKSKQFVDDPKQGLPIIRIRDLNSQSPSKYYAGEVSEEYKVNAGDILVGMDGQFDCVEWQGEQAALNQRVLRVFPTENSEKKFLHYMLTPILKVLEGQITGTTVKHLSTRNLKSLNLPIPPLTEQKRIAEVLSSVDESIQATQRLIEQAERVKQGLMEELLTGGLGSEAIERGEVPEGWQRLTIGEVCKVVTGKTPSTKDAELWNGAIPFFSPADLDGEHIVYSAARAISEKALSKGAKLLPKNAILYTCIGSTIGKVAITNVECCTNQQINACIVSTEHDYRFMYYQLVFIEHIVKSFSSTTAVPIINKSAFSSIQMLVPPLIVQKEIAEALISIDELIEKHKTAAVEYNVVKKGLMDDLLTGKVRTV